MFISFEGGDGAGKSTHVRALAQWLRDRGENDVVVTREPGGTALGVRLREILLHGADMDPRAESLIYAADRAQHVAEVIRPALDRGAIVITDRYLDSSVAYQAGGRVLNPGDIERISLWATGGLLPDRTYLLDVPRDIAEQRLGDERDRLERAGEDFHRRTREAFLSRAAADPGRWRVVDGSASVDEVSEQIVTDVSELLGMAP